MAPQATSTLHSLDSGSHRDDREAIKEVPAAPVSSSVAVGEMSGPLSAPEAPPTSGVVSPRAALDDDWPTLAVLSRRYIGRALEHTSGNKTRAADLLGIDRRTLNRILARERAKASAAAKAQANGVAPAAAAR